ncbi:potassium transporter TrkA [Streptomyces poonensis]|uniref:potassium transporter TrkA n=1 Tax=Streptomyces poonensis TaxID=68255 RepID=UPI001672A709|nr:potassium transporter TrkA [Streptomyces poonensis]
MSGAPHLVVLGTGSLARSVCCSLAATRSGPLRVTVAGRDVRAADEIAYLAGSRALLSGAPIDFDAAYVDPGSPAVTELLARTSPRLLVVCASSQSPWERTRHPSAWTDLIAEAGFGLTLPLQAEIPVRAARAVADAAPDTLLINACFPDAVNPLLKTLNLPVLCGIGNAGLVAASLGHALGLGPTPRLKVLAHHVHLHPPADPADEARAWLDGAPLPDVTALLTRQRTTDRERLNLVTGHTAALLIAALAHGHTLYTSLPGPHGLPGGYPVTARDGTLTLDLPPLLTEQEATEWNQRVGTGDGVTVHDGRVRFTGPAQAAVTAYAPALAEGFAATALDEAQTELKTVRDRLRRRAARPRLEERCP